MHNNVSISQQQHSSKKYSYQNSFNSNNNEVLHSPNQNKNSSNSILKKTSYPTILKSNNPCTEVTNTSHNNTLNSSYNKTRITNQRSPLLQVSLAPILSSDEKPKFVSNPMTPQSLVNDKKILFSYPVDIDKSNYPVPHVFFL